MTNPADQTAGLLQRSLESGRIHSSYLLSGAGPEARQAALDFVRGLVCNGAAPQPCDACPSCHRSQATAEIAIDGTGKKGPLFRHVGDHPDLLWIERGPSDTRVRIGQIRALQHALRLRIDEGDRRAAVIADAEWLNVEAQNALLRLLEEPPPRTTLVLVASSSAGLLATVRSRCQRVKFSPVAADLLDDPEQREIVARLETLAGGGLPAVLEWAEEYRGARASVVGAVHGLLQTSSTWLRQRVAAGVQEPGRDVGPELEAGRTLSSCRKALDQRNANPQMVAERALLALRETARR